MKCYKGFDKNMQCRGFQFKEGEIYELPEGQEAKLCKNGFHACEMPLDVFNYYRPADSEYHEVELEDVSTERKGDSKVCGRRIKIGAKLSIKNIVDAQIEYVKERTHEVKGGRTHANYGAASATGKGSIAIASGFQGKAKAALGCAICLCERGQWDGETFPLLAVKAAIVDGQNIKPDTWYVLINGEFVEKK